MEGGLKTHDNAPPRGVSPATGSLRKGEGVGEEEAGDEDIGGGESNNSGCFLSDVMNTITCFVARY